jgi:hypothetical protein
MTINAFLSTHQPVIGELEISTLRFATPLCVNRISKLNFVVERFFSQKKRNKKRHLAPPTHDKLKRSGISSTVCAI